MFKIEYDITKASFDEIETITDEEIRYYWFLGHATFISENATISMDWGRIPLLDFCLSLSEIAKALYNVENSTEYFEFTESADTLEFSKTGNKLRITPSFSPAIIEIAFDEYTREVEDLHKKISTYIKKESGDKLISSALDKYL